MTPKQKLVSSIIAGVVLILSAVATYYGVSWNSPPIGDGGVSLDSGPPNDLKEDVLPVDFGKDLLPIDIGKDVQPDTSPPSNSSLTEIREKYKPLVANIDTSKFPKDTGGGNDLTIAPIEGLGAAITEANNGDTILITGGGTYTGEITINKTLYIKTDIPATITGAGRIGVRINAPNVVLKGFTISGFTEVGILFGGTSENVVLSNITISNTEEGIATWGHQLNGLLAKHIAITNYALIGFHCGNGPCNNWMLDDVLIDGNPTNGQGWGSDAFAIESGDNIFLNNITITGSGSDCIDTKGNDVLIHNARVRGCANNSIKLWNGGDVLASKIVRTGPQSAVIVEKGSFHMEDTTLTYEGAVRRTSSISFSYDPNEPMNIRLINSTISNRSGPVRINSNTRKEDVEINNCKFYLEDTQTELIVHTNHREFLHRNGIEPINTYFQGGGNTLLIEKP